MISLLQVEERRIDIRTPLLPTANLWAIGAYRLTRARSTCERYLAIPVAERWSEARTRARETMCSDYPEVDIR